MSRVLAFGGQWGWGAWLWLVVPLAAYGLISLTLFALGETDDDNIVTFFFGQIADSLQRATGYPGWSMAGVLSGLLFLLILVVGFYWDVAWHIDNGRDTQIFTVPHTMILVGLGGLIYAAFLTVLFASLDEDAEVGFKVGPARVPWSALLLLALGAGAIAAFPLDNLWHHAYGIDVTLWSPTHLQLVGGGSLATIALFLMCAEARDAAQPTWLGRAIFVLTGGTILVALSTFQGEFDFGVPQFQTLYLPLLITAAATFALVLARIAFGRWGALKVTLVYLVLQGSVTLVVAGALHHTTPRFPLYLPSALAVEAAAWAVGSARRFHLAVVAGAVVGTLGLVGEVVWIGLSGWASGAEPAAWVVKVVVLAPLAAGAAGILGAGLARAAARRAGPVPLVALALAGVVLVGVFAYPLPRRVGHVTAVIRTQPVGDRAQVEVDLVPPDAAKDATAFAVTSWQGGGRVTARLERLAPGRYRSATTVPVTGRWKTTVNLSRRDQVMAAPVYLPADPQIGAAAVPMLPERAVTFVRVTTLLLREKHGGGAWPAIAAYSGLASLLALWIALMALAAARIGKTAVMTVPDDPAPRFDPPAPMAPQARPMPVGARRFS